MDRIWPHEVALPAYRCFGNNYLRIQYLCEALSHYPRTHWFRRGAFCAQEAYRINGLSSACNLGEIGQRDRASVRWGQRNLLSQSHSNYRERGRVRATWFEPRLPIFGSSIGRKDPFVVRRAGKSP
jgi:hypothetical protein